MNDADSRMLTPLLRDAVKPVAYGRIADQTPFSQDQERSAPLPPTTPFG